MNNLYAIYAENSPFTFIDDSVCSTNFYTTSYSDKDGTGIALLRSNSSTIEDCEVTNFDAGIYVYRSHPAEIRDCTIKNNWNGIATWTSDLTILRNTIEDNFEGITVFAGSEMQSTNIEIKYNTIKDNEYYGVNFYSYSHDNVVHHNNFENNNPTGTSQAKDDGTSNIWYDVTVNEGNFWSDHSTSSPYSIDGTASAVDPYPLVTSIPEFKTLYFLICVSSIPLLFVPYVRRKKQ
jgi:parallel beta-helix repeat protein